MCHCQRCTPDWLVIHFFIWDNHVLQHKHNLILANNSEWLIAFTVDANVICTGTNIVIEIEQLHSVGLHKDYLRLNDPDCTLDSNGTHVLANFSLNACGTMIEVKLFSWAQNKGTVYQKVVISLSSCPSEPILFFIKHTRWY